MKISKLVLLFFIISPLLSACNEVKQVVDNELNKIQCSSPEANQLFSDLFNNNMFEQGVTDKSISARLESIHTLESKFGSTRMSCSGTAVISMPFDVLDNAESAYGDIKKIQELSSDLGLNNNDFNINISESSIKSYLSNKDYLVKSNITIEKDIYYNLSVSDDGITTRIELIDGGFQPLYKVINLSKKKDEIQAIVEKLEEEIEQQKREIKLEILSDALVNYVDDNGQSLLNSAYELTFGSLNYQSTELYDSALLEDGYQVKVKIKYLNLFDSPQYLIFSATFNNDGEPVSAEYTGHSDIIAPNSLTFESVLRGLQSLQQTQ